MYSHLYNEAIIIPVFGPAALVLAVLVVIFILLRVVWW